MAVYLLGQYIKQIVFTNQIVARPSLTSIIYYNTLTSSTRCLLPVIDSLVQLSSYNFNQIYSKLHFIASNRWTSQISGLKPF